MMMTHTQTIKLEEFISAVPDFPKPGILFRDITPMLASPQAFTECLRQLSARAEKLRATHIIGIESRGFIFGAPLADRLQLPLVLARKPGKLPRDIHTVTYELEYGVDQLCLHRDDLPPGARVLIVDDLLATGGTASACIELARRAEAKVVGALFVIELEGLGGRYRLDQSNVGESSETRAEGVTVEALLKY